MKVPVSKRWVTLVVAIVAALAWLYEREALPTTGPTGGGYEGVARAFEDRQSGRMLEFEGEVVRLLSDDTQGDRHQRFIVGVGDGLTVLVAHNIDIAPRVPLHRGDLVRLRGQYEWNDRGGVLHWTHRDPDGSRSDTGWIRHEGRRYR